MATATRPAKTAITLPRKAALTIAMAVGDAAHNLGMRPQDMRDAAGSRAVRAIAAAFHKAFTTAGRRDTEITISLRADHLATATAYMAHRIATTTPCPVGSAAAAMAAADREAALAALNAAQAHA